MTTFIPTTITSQYNLNTPNITYALTGNTTVTTVTAPFNVTAGGIVFDGRGYTITINGITNFLGLFNAALTVQNLSLDATGTYSLNRGMPGSDPSQDASWFMKCQISAPTIISNCTNYANLDPRGSAFFGGNTSNCTAISCTNKCPSRQGDAAIFGTNASNCTARNCVSTSPARSVAGAAIFGSSSVDCTAINCACLEGGTIGGYGAGIFSFASLRGTASNCLNRTPINGTVPVYYVAGGIFAGPCSSGSAINCYNSGAVSATAPNLAYAIIGEEAVTATTTNCYTTNGTIGPAGVTQTNSYSDPAGAWRDSNASVYLTGAPSATPTNYPTAGSIWYSTALNTPYSLISLLNIPCFLAGARILTPTGYRRVETLADNDEVTTSDGRSVPVKIFKTTVHKTDEDTAPFVIEKGAISYNVPDEDLHVSGAHVIQDARGVWQIPAGLATHPGSRVYQHLPGRAATYYHVECPNFFTDDLVANNCVVESFRNRQGTSENSYTYDIDLGGFVRIHNHEHPSEKSADVLAVSF